MSLRRRCGFVVAASMSLRRRCGFVIAASCVCTISLVRSMGVVGVFATAPDTPPGVNSTMTGVITNLYFAIALGEYRTQTLAIGLGFNLAHVTLNDSGMWSIMLNTTT